ncbi:Subtilase family protein [Parelusimicrobium proximum]|uniref:S8 family peptidase n=1 Tax=Parelusimicrobium proximum TaxID=3228953 RepID=UPI003D17971C
MKKFLSFIIFSSLITPSAFAVTSEPHVSALERSRRDNKRVYRVNYSNPYDVTNPQVHQFSPSWPYEKLNLSSAHNKGITGKGVNIAIIDSGFNCANLSQNCHGTYIQKVISNSLDSRQKGVAPDAKVYAFPLTPGAVGAAIMTIALETVRSHNQSAPADAKIHIVNLSYGADGYYAPLAEAVRALHKEGVLVVAAAGNTPKLSKILFPADMPETIAVGSLTPMNTVGNSNYNPNPDMSARHVDLIAPGEAVSVYDEQGQMLSYGSSIPTAFISGLAALAIQTYKQLNGGANPTPDQIKNMLIASSGRIYGIDARKQGYGVPDAEKLTASIGSGKK